MKANLAMKRLIATAVLKVPLHPELNAIAKAGFDTSEGCYFLTALLDTVAHMNKASFHDRTGYECFANSVHIEDYVEKGALSQALQFVAAVFSEWTSKGLPIKLVAIISADEPSVVVKFHVKRAFEEWLSEDVEDYGDSIVSIESSEDLALLINWPHGG